MNEKILHWGIMGTARINRALIPPLNVSHRNRLLAVASRELERARHYAREKGIERAHGSYEALLADPEIDVVYISLPNCLHAEWTIKAAAAGKHVLCEKPIALSTQDVTAIADAATKHGVVIAEAFMYRHHPQTLKGCELIESGVIGEMRLIRGGFSYPLSRAGDVRLKPELGGGSIWDVGCYPISFARTALGGAAPSEVFGWQIMGPTGVDVSFFGQMRYTNGVCVQIDSSFQSALRMVMEFVGSEGCITLDNAFKPDGDSQLSLQRGDGSIEILRFPDQELYLSEVEDLYDAVVHGKRQLIPLDDSSKNIATILALLESARASAAVQLT